jgi:anti-sigma regulatory factor (Ser/Thr protein kinase)
MLSRTDDLISLELPCDEHAPVIVRDALAEIHDGGWSLDDGRLVASELVGNAVRHSGCQLHHRLRIRVSRYEGRLRISVHDPGLSGQAAYPGDGDAAQPGGWGLRIIAQLSEAWGTERPNGYRVWADLPARA